MQHEVIEKSKEIDKLKEGNQNSGDILQRNVSDSSTHEYKEDLTVSSPQFSETKALREEKDQKDDPKTPNYNHKVTYVFAHYVWLLCSVCAHMIV